MLPLLCGAATGGATEKIGTCLYFRDARGTPRQPTYYSLLCTLLILLYVPCKELISTVIPLISHIRTRFRVIS